MLSIKQYSSEFKAKWDNFVINESVNGTFLQTRQFLEYHGDRFEDESIMIYKGTDTILAVIPACKIVENENKIFSSHAGSTFGGIVISKIFYDTHHIQEMLDLLEQYWHDNQYDEVNLKITPKLFARKSPDLLEYMLFLNKFENYCELSTYIDYSNYDDTVVSNFNFNKRKLVRKMLDMDLVFRRLWEDSEVADFFALLTLNLTKYNAKPIHTLEEILDFKNNRLKENVRFYGVYKDNEQLAGGMMFNFPETLTIHAQNLSADPYSHTGKLDPITFLYYSLICEYKRLGYKNLSWGISTENKGSALNFSLIKNKESYGSSYSCNKTFYKFLKK